MPKYAAWLLTALPVAHLFHGGSSFEAHFACPRANVRRRKWIKKKFLKVKPNSLVVSLLAGIPWEYFKNEQYCGLYQCLLLVGNTLYK